MPRNFEDIPAAVYDQFIKEQFGNQFIKENGREYNFVCPNPACGDLSRPNKKKAYVFKDTWLYTCYKCTAYIPFALWLKEHDEPAYQRMLFAAFGNASGGDNSFSRKVGTADRPAPPEGLPFKEGEIISIMANHPLAETGRQICMSRRIREDVWSNWFVCLPGEQFYDRDENGNIKLDPYTGRPTGNEYRNRIIIPFYHFGGKWTQFDARDVNPESQMRYRNYAGVKRTAYNLDFINFDEPFYILEGTIDSTFIHNAIAIGGVPHFDEVIAECPAILEHKANCTVIWDNDGAGQSARWQSAVDKGFKWFSWEGIHSKDVNNAVLAGEMPVDEEGFVCDDFIKARIRESESAGIMFTLKYGNLRKEAWKKKREAIKAIKDRNKTSSSSPEVYF